VLRTGTLDAAHLTVLKNVELSDNTLTVSVSGAESTFSFVGQDGAIRKTVKDAVAASYTIAANDTYVRTVITAPQTVLYVNPILRYDGAGPPRPTARVDVAATWALRGGSAVGLAVVSLAYARRRRRAQYPVARPVLASAK
jgi:hypothetical protein